MMYLALKSSKALQTRIKWNSPSISGSLQICHNRSFLEILFGPSLADSIRHLSDNLTFDIQVLIHLLYIKSK